MRERTLRHGYNSSGRRKLHGKDRRSPHRWQQIRSTRHTSARACEHHFISPGHSDDIEQIYKMYISRSSHAVFTWLVDLFGKRIANLFSRIKVRSRYGFYWERMNSNTRASFTAYIHVQSVSCSQKRVEEEQCEYGGFVSNTHSGPHQDRVIKGNWTFLSHRLIHFF